MKNENTKLLEDFKRKYITNNKNIKKKVLTNNAAYEGEIVNKKPNGKGIFIFESGETYFGDFVEGSFHGSGTYIFNVFYIY